MSEHPGLEFAPQKTRSQMLPSMPPLVLFIISMGSTVKSDGSTGDETISALCLRPLKPSLVWHFMSVELLQMISPAL